jgi:hypothetical protein
MPAYRADRTGGVLVAVPPPSAPCCTRSFFARMPLIEYTIDLDADGATLMAIAPIAPRCFS